MTLLALILIGGGSVWAGTANSPKNAASLVDGLCIVLKADDTAQTNYFNGSDANSATFSNSMVYRVVMNTEGDAFYLRRLSDGKYLPKFVANNTVFAAMVEDKANAQTFTASDVVVDGFSHVRFSCSDQTDEFINCNSSGAAAKYHNGTGGYSFFNVIDASTMTLVPSTSENPVWYYLNSEASGYNKYIYADENDVVLQTKDSPSTDAYKWRIEGETYLDFQIINNNGKHIASNTIESCNGNQLGYLVSEDGTTYYSHFRLGPATETFQLNNNEGAATGIYLCVWGKDVTQLKLYSTKHSTNTFVATNASQVTVAYTYKMDGADDIVINVEQPIGSAFQAPVVPAFGSISSLSNNGFVGIENTTCDVNYTQSLPFTPGNVYRLKVRHEGNKAVAFADNKPKTNSATASDFAQNNLWAFERVTGTFNDFKIYNLGAAQYINGNGFSAAGKAYTIGEFAGHDGGFNFVVTGSTNNSLGDHSNANTELGEWSGGSNKNDAGSCFWVEDITSEISALTTMGDPNSTFLGLQQHPVNATAKTTAASAPTVANVKALFAVNFADAVDCNKYYRLRCQATDRSNRYIYSDIHANTNGVVDDASSEHRYVKSEAETSVVNTLFKFEKDGENDTYYIQHVNSGKYLFGGTSGNVDLPFYKTSAGTYEPTQVNGEWWGIKRTGTNVHLHQSNHGDAKLLLWGALNAEAASNWTIEEVTEIPVTVGAAGYSTFCAPVNVVVPNTVEAYIISNSTDENVTLTQVKSTILPANTGVILKNQGDHIFTITNDAANIDVTGNQLTGTTIRRQGFAENSIYVLALDNGSVALCPNGTVEGVPANKAYLANGSAGVAALGFSFEAVETAIQKLEAEQMANSTIYDLSGRKVSKADKGMFIINGKKVLK